MNLLITLNPENASEAEAQTYSLRQAVRAVVLDQHNHIALLYVANRNYYKLPGGGIEPGESYAAALQRECLEEIGCNIERIGDLGKIVEYRRFCRLKQISYCYLAKIKGIKTAPHFTTSETEKGFAVKWLSYPKALSLLSKSQATDIEGHLYITPRDTLILNKAISSTHSPARKSSP
jgi:8-oxo-dGTP diphosphatase